MWGRGLVGMFLALHRAVPTQPADDLLNLLFVRIGVVAVRNKPMGDVLGVREEGLEESVGIAFRYGLMVGLVVFNLGVRLECESLPIRHEPFDKVVRPLVIGRRELGGVGRIEIRDVCLGLGEQDIHVLTAGLAFLVNSPPSNTTNYLDIGYHAGAGAEYMIVKELSLGIDYRYTMGVGDPQLKVKYSSFGANIGINF